MRDRKFRFLPIISLVLLATIFLVVYLSIVHQSNVQLNISEIIITLVVMMVSILIIVVLCMWFVFWGKIRILEAKLQPEKMEELKNTPEI